jgi:Fe-S oxidoreductase
VEKLKFVEMAQARENARCCGAGGGFRAAFGKLSVAIGMLRTQDAKAVNAQILASGCPFCTYNLRHAAAAGGKAVPAVLDYAELIARLLS